MEASPGTIVRYRERDWVVLPSEDQDVVLLRPVGGREREITGVYRPIYEKLCSRIPYEKIEPATFPLPDPASAQDHTSVRLFVQSARLLLRDGTAPFRSLGRISFRPRPYQFVPLMMAMKLDVVRMLIADDVGVGKTIEGGLIARELIDRGTISRLAVLCPPYLCDQWQKELSEKFNIDAVVIRSSTVSKLERMTPPDICIFEHFRYFVASVDLVKQKRFKDLFTRCCPNFVIVDEAHGAARPRSSSSSRDIQMRYELVKKLSENPKRHMILLTATPHSGIGESFRSLLGILNPDFERINFQNLQEDDIVCLVPHFIQRRRADVANWMEEETPFPERINKERPYYFSGEYREYYSDIYNFAMQMVRSAETLTGWKKRMRFLSALAMLRCVTSSPAAAIATLKARLEKRGEPQDALRMEARVKDLESATDDELKEEYESYIYDIMDTEKAFDVAPEGVLDAVGSDLKDSERRALRNFAKCAERLKGAADTKIKTLIEVIEELLRDGYSPVVWCRYIATSDYVAENIKNALGSKIKDLEVRSVTGALTDEARSLMVDELSSYEKRVLVATDCLSEGINLQEYFDAVVHYDLPWNPNRLEQREGRVDRYGQMKKTVKAVLIYGKDNPVDAAVLDVLLRKAREIHRDLKVHVPVPVDSESVIETVLRLLLTRARTQEGQLRLFDEDLEAKKIADEIHKRWVSAAEREKKSQTRFAQRSIKPEELKRELAETDSVLGGPAEVRRFLKDASDKLSVNLKKKNGDIWDLETKTLPSSVKERLKGARAGAAVSLPEIWKITLTSPTPEGTTYIGRNHPLIEGMAEYLFDLASYPTDDGAHASRLGAIRTRDVRIRTTLFLLRARYLISEPDSPSPLLAEEILCTGFEGIPPGISLLSLEKARELFDHAQAAANMSFEEKREILEETLSWWDDLKRLIESLLDERHKELISSYKRVSRAMKSEKVEIECKKPPDLLAALVLIPMPGGGAA